MAGALVGLLAGFAVGYLLTDREPDPRSLVAEVRAGVRGAAALLEVTQVEYEEAIAGEEVASEQEYQGAQAALRRSRARYERAGQVLRALGHDEATDIEDAYDELERMVEEPAPTQQVTALIDRLVVMLEDLAEGR